MTEGASAEGKDKMTAAQSTSLLDSAPAAAAVGQPAGQPLNDLTDSLEDAALRLSDHFQAALGKRIAVSPGAVTPVEGDNAAAELGASVSVRAAVRAGGVDAALMLIASEKAALCLAGLSSAAGPPAALDDAANSALAATAKTFFAGLVKGLPGVAVTVGLPEKLASLPDDFRGEGSALSEMTLTQADGEPIAARLALSPKAARLLVAAVAAPQQEKVQRILNISVPVVVEIARKRITIKDIVALKPGTVVEFEKKSDDFLNLMAGKAQIANGEAVKVGESFGLRILGVGSVKERIAGLAR